MKFKIAPSILSADFSKLAEEIKKINVEGTGYIHVDVMDGHFVPNITIGAPVVKCIKKASLGIPLDVHLMISEPEKYINDFAKAGSDIITIHFEAPKNPVKVLEDIKSKGIKAGISIKPNTPVAAIQFLLDKVDLVLIMTVEPGFSGQKLIPHTIEKIREIKKLKDQNHYKFIIQADGGVTEENIHEYVSAGAELVVGGNAVFAAPDPTQAIKNLIEKGQK